MSLNLLHNSAVDLNFPSATVWQSCRCISSLRRRGTDWEFYTSYFPCVARSAHECTKSIWYAAHIREERKVVKQLPRVGDNVKIICRHIWTSDRLHAVTVWLFFSPNGYIQLKFFVTNVTTEFGLESNTREDFFIFSWSFFHKRLCLKLVTVSPLPVDSRS